MNMKKIILMLLILSFVIYSCTDEKDSLISVPKDINFENLELDRFSYNIPSNGFKSDILNFNTIKNEDGSFSGFAYSNKSNRSFTFTNDKEEIDGNIFSVYTKYPNQTQNYAVAKVKDDDAYFTLDIPSQIEHILVANNTYTYLALMYGDQYGAEEDPKANPNIPAKPEGVWYTYVPGGVKKMNTKDKDYFKLIIKGFINGKETGEIEFYMCSKGGDPEHTNYDYVIQDWYKVDLRGLGIIDKVVFNLDSSDKDANGDMRTPAYFCIDGIRIKR